MNNRIKLRVWGKYACFTNPHFPERHSYPIPTPSALVGLLESIYWKPEMSWKIHNVHLLNDIQYQTIKLNEVKKIQFPDKPMVVEKNRTQVSTRVLVNPDYIIDASIHSIDELTKHMSIFRRRVEKGQCFRDPFLGTSECLAFFEFPNGQEPVHITRDFGLMLHSIDYGSGRCRLFQARAEEGVVNTEQIIGGMDVC